mmetsp:Transcript_23895/g.75739  ORF Transcript_23895/g.75739 Transcript_23895/m.75739 type:complete len:251 (-) Transcript_23895:69-821(-)
MVARAAGRSSSCRGAVQRRNSLARLGLAAAGFCLLAGALARACSGAFVAGTAAGPATRMARPIRAEPEKAAPAPAPAPSSALVVINEETKATTVSVLGGLVGLLVGGVWIGAAAFAATAYLSRREDDDIAKALKGIAGGALEALNYGASLNEKYEVTGKVGSALTDALENAKKNPDAKQTISSITSAADGVANAVKNFDQEVGIKDSLGSLATTASESAFKAVDKAVDLEKEYKVTDQLKQKIEDATKSK